MVVHRSDEHLGAYYEDEAGTVIYDDEIAAKRVRTVSDRVFNLKERHEAAGVEFDCVHVLLGGVASTARASTMISRGSRVSPSSSRSPSTWISTASSSTELQRSSPSFKSLVRTATTGNYAGTA